MCAVITVFTIIRKDARYKAEFIFATITSAWWVFCQAFELMGTNLDIKIIWANIQYIGYLNAFAYFLLSCRLTGFDKWINKYSIMFMLFIYAIFFVLIFTDKYHGLMRYNFSLDTSTIPYTINKQYGALYYVYYAYAGGVNLLSYVVLSLAIIQKSAIRKQAIIFIIGLTPIAISNAVYVLNLSPIPHDITPVFFAFSGLIYAYGIRRLDLINIYPIAKDLLLETIDDGIFVLDKTDHLTNMNLAMYKIVGAKYKKLNGTSLDKLPILQNLINDAKNGNMNINDKTYLVKSMPINDKRKTFLGTMYIFSDITEQEKNTEIIIRQQKAISIIKERENFGRELHDSIGQAFVYVNVQAQSIKENLSTGKTDTAKKQLDELVIASRTTHTEIRDYILEMRGISPRNRNFSAVLKSYLMEYKKKYGLDVNLVFDDSLPDGFPPETIAKQLLRIIQESLTNIQKHAGENARCEISFCEKEDFIVLTIKDDGLGFDIDKLQGTGSHGLYIMEERSQEIGALFEINSLVGKGTIITITMNKGNV
jgi:signal transduction histidine kinase